MQRTATRRDASEAQWMRALLLAIAVLWLAGCRTVEIAPYDASGAVHALRVAMVSMECSMDPAENRRRMLDYVTTIMNQHPDVDLICFGETTLGWYWKPFGARSYQEEVAEPIDGPTVSGLRVLAAEHGAYISFGFAEVVGDLLYNAAAIISPDGEIVAHRRKSHFVVMDTLSGYTRGEKEVTVATIGTTKVALLICNDFNSRAYQEVINGDPDIQVLLLPHATANLEPDFWENYRYNFKGMWMLSAQRYGAENRRQYHGSWILDPNGYMVAYADSGPGFFVYDVAISGDFP